MNATFTTLTGSEITKVYIDTDRKAIPRKDACRACGAPVESTDRIVKVEMQHTGWHGVAWVHAHCGDDAIAKGVVGSPTLERTKQRPERSAQDVATFLSGAQTLLDQIRNLEEKVEQLEECKPRRIEVKIADHEAREIKGRMHKQFEKILKYAAIRAEIFLAGPTGCGKTHLAEQIADALGLKFYVDSCSGGKTESLFFGTKCPNLSTGKYEFEGTAFLEAYENGGVMLLDELDASDDNVIVSLNAALSNGYMPVPHRSENRIAKRHPDFVIIATANTFGSGASREYCGRNKLDGASLDRFRCGMFELDYDQDLERDLSYSDELYNWLISIRIKVNENRLERHVTTRTIINFSKHLAAGLSLADCRERLFCGWRQDEIAKVSG